MGDLEVAHRWMHALEEAACSPAPAAFIHQLAGEIDALAATNRDLTQQIDKLGINKEEFELSGRLQTPRVDADPAPPHHAREVAPSVRRRTAVEGLPDDSVAKHHADLDKLRRAAEALRSLSESLRSTPPS